MAVTLHEELRKLFTEDEIVAVSSSIMGVALLNLAPEVRDVMLAGVVACCQKFGLPIELVEQETRH